MYMLQWKTNSCTHWMDLRKVTPATAEKIKQTYEKKFKLFIFRLLPIEK